MKKKTTNTKKYNVDLEHKMKTLEEEISRLNGIVEGLKETVRINNENNIQKTVLMGLQLCNEQFVNAHYITNHSNHTALNLEENNA